MNEINWQDNYIIKKFCSNVCVLLNDSEIELIKVQRTLSLESAHSILIENLIKYLQPEVK